jgi:20S proteasome subunit beta 5
MAASTLNLDFLDLASEQEENVLEREVLDMDRFPLPAGNVRVPLFSAPLNRLLMWLVSMQPSTFLNDAFQDGQAEPIKMLHGTTTLSFVFQGGIVVAVDSRATQGTYIGTFLQLCGWGVLWLLPPPPQTRIFHLVLTPFSCLHSIVRISVASQSVQKVIKINPHLVGTMAGGAADCAYWERELGRRTRLYELRNKERMTVAAASKVLANILYYYRNQGLSVGSMICGWDKRVPATPSTSCLYVFSLCS